MVGHAATPKKRLSFHPGLALLQGVSWGLTLVSLSMWLAGSMAGTAVVGWVVGLLVAASLVRAPDWVRLVIRALAGALWTKWAVAPAVAGCLVVVVLEAAKGQKWRSAIAALAPIVLVLAPVMVRNSIATGDPFFPIMTGLVRGEVPGVDPELMDTVSQRHREIPGPLGIPWGTSIGKVESDEVIGWHHLIGLGLLPLLLRDRRVRLAAALVVPYFIVGVFYHPSIRLAMPMIWGLAVVEELVPGAQAAAFVNRQPEPGRVMALDFPAPFLFDRPWVAEGLVNRPPMSLWLEQTLSVDDLLAELRRNDVRWIIVTPGYGGGRPQSMLPVASTPEEAGIVLSLRQHLELVFSEEKVDVWRVREQ